MILVKRGISIAASVVVVSLRAAVGSRHFEHFARHDGGWDAKSPGLCAPIPLLHAVLLRGSWLGIQIMRWSKKGVHYTLLMEQRCLTVVG